jgi:hypothetical protein
MMDARMKLMEITMQLENKVAALCKKRGMTRTDFLAECIRADACSYDTAQRLYDGETGFQYSTLVKVAAMMKVNVTDLVDTRRG